PSGSSSGLPSASAFSPDISYWIPAVALRPVHFSPTARYHLHNGYTVRPSCGTPSRIRSDTRLLKAGIDFLPAGNLPLSLLLHRSPSLRFSGISLPSVLPSHLLPVFSTDSARLCDSVYRNTLTGQGRLPLYSPARCTLLS